jgi:hypothetical protein
MLFPHHISHNHLWRWNSYHDVGHTGFGQNVLMIRGKWLNLCLLAPSLKKMSEGGIQKRLQRLHWWQHVGCTHDSVKSIHLRHVSMVFLYLLAGLLLSAVKLLCERASSCPRHTGQDMRVVGRTSHNIRLRNITDPAGRSLFLQHIE